MDSKRTLGKALGLVPLSSALLLATTVAVSAQTAETGANDSGDPTMSFQEQALRGGDRGWNRSDMRRAQPFPMPRIDWDGPGEHREMAPTGDVTVNPAVKPLVNDPMTRLEGRKAPSQPRHRDLGRQTDAAAPLMQSSRGQPFTSVRAGPRLITREFPHRAVGRLFFERNGNPFVCSGAVISKRLIMTAAHCVYDPDEGFFDQFRFLPAYDDTKFFATPYCQWAADRVIVPQEYDGSVVTEYDFAIIQARDRNCRRFTPRSVGEITGALGWASNLLIGNNVTQVGYPMNLDSGMLMQKTHSDVVEVNINNATTGQIGSAQSGGTSGGPWVQNFGNFADGMVPIGPDGFDELYTIVAVSSYGATAHNANQIGGASILNDAWERIWNTACGWESDNCD